MYALARTAEDATLFCPLKPPRTISPSTSGQNSTMAPASLVFRRSDMPAAKLPIAQ